MKNLSLKKYLISGLLIICGMIGALPGCGNKESRQARNESGRQFFSIGGELQWEPHFSWHYFPQDERADGEIAGYFKREKLIGERTWPVMAAVSEAVYDWRNGNIIAVYHDTLSEEALFALINSRIGQWAEKYPETEVVCRINGSTEIDQFIQLDAAKEHLLYIRAKDSVYILYGEMYGDKWRKFLNEWLLTSNLEWNDLVVLKEDGTVEDPYTGRKREEGIRRMFQYGEKCMEITGDTLLFHRQEDGFYFKMESGDEENRLMEEVVLQSADICLEHDSWEEAVSYFENKYPDMYTLKANLYGENTLWDSEEGSHEQIFYQVKEPEGSHGFFLQDGKVFEVLSQGKPDYNMVDTARNTAGYDYNACFLWKREEDGSIMYEDNLAGKFSYLKDLGNEKIIRFQAEITEKVKGELTDNVTYSVKIFDEEGHGLLQEIQVNSTYSHKSPFTFEDFNADGYQDLTAEYYYGANGGSASHYIFSPSKKEFVELDSELNYYGMYWVDYEKRRLHMHYHASAIDGTEITYQWKNEMDYEIIKQYEHKRVDDGVQVKIVRYDNGKEEILSDYLYSFDECMERNDIWGTYYEDFIWEKEITDQPTGKKYVIRYAEAFLPEEADRNNGIYYDGRIYVYDEDTYLVSVTHSEIVSQSDRIEWENGGGDKTPAVVIHYVDGGSSIFYLSGLIQPDYPQN